MKIFGIVQRHLGRGKKIGFPTANIQAPSGIEDAIYLAYTHIGPKKYHSIVFVGAPPTFAETERRLEAHVLDFEGDLYGKAIGVEILKKLRDNRRFSSEAGLISQMKEDERLAREYFAGIAES